MSWPTWALPIVPVKFGCFSIWYVYLRTPEGGEKRRRRTKILGLATMPKAVAQKALDNLISLSAGQPSPGWLPANPTFAQL